MCNNRGVKHFDANVFNNDLQNKLDLSVLDDKKNVNSAYQMFSNAFFRNRKQTCSFEKEKCFTQTTPLYEQKFKTGDL